MGWIIAIAIIATHFVFFKEYYISIILGYCVKFLLERLLMAIGDYEKAKLISLCGYCIIGISLVGLIGATLNTLSNGDFNIEPFLTQLKKAL